MNIAIIIVVVYTVDEDTQVSTAHSSCLEIVFWTISLFMNNNAKGSLEENHLLRAFQFRLFLREDAQDSFLGTGTHERVLVTDYR